MKLVVLNHLSLDGVMQAPGRSHEDTRGGFLHGGWAIPNSDEVMANLAGPGRTAGEGLLLGRRSYEGMLSAWNQRGGPYKDALNNAPKFVASHSGSTQGAAWRRPAHQGERGPDSLVESVTTPKGVIFAEYQLGEADRKRSSSTAASRVESS